VHEDILAIPHYTASYVEFRSPYIDMDADTTWGWDSVDVAFDALPRLGFVADSWVWSFGDGDSAFVQSPTHTFQGRGTYNVTVQMNAGGDTYSYTRKHLVAVLADSLTGIDVETTNSLVEFEIAVTNTVPLYWMRIPVEYAGPLGLRYVDYSVESCRTGGFGEVLVSFQDSALSRFEIELDADGERVLPPGSGPVLKLQFEITGGKQGQNVSSLELGGFTDHTPRFRGPLANYDPIATGGSVTMTGCCFGLTGNVDGDIDEIVDIGDLTALISYLYIPPNPEPPCAQEANIDGDTGGLVDIGDLTALISYLYIPPNPIPPHCP
jgi:PKD repeat protein